MIVILLDNTMLNYRVFFTSSTLFLAFILSGCQPKDSAVPEQAPIQTKPQAKPAPTLTLDDNTRAVYDKLNQNFAKAGINARILDIQKSPLPEWYLVSIEGNAPIFAHQSGDYMMQGAILGFENGKFTDLSAKMMQKESAKALAAVPKNELITYAPKATPKAKIYVFTDITCGYCQKLHQEIDDITKGGIEVNYLAWPRGEQTVIPMQNVWCAADKHQALSDAKHGKSAPQASCNDPVREHMALGHRLGVNGTPAIFTENGTQIGGYLPADELIKLAIDNKN